MNIYEKLQQEVFDNKIMLKEVPLKSNSNGLYYNGKIALNTNKLYCDTEKACVLAEELGHHYTSNGNIIDLNDLGNSKQEYKARSVAYEKLISINKFIDALKYDFENKFEFIEYLGVTESFFEDAINYYKNKYGLSVDIDSYTIVFEPSLQIIKRLE